VGLHPNDRPQVHLLEFDRRFEVFREFTFYDFEKPTTLPSMNLTLDIANIIVEFKGAFDRLLCDPPFLSEACQTKGRDGGCCSSNRTSGPHSALDVWRAMGRRFSKAGVLHG
jgi:hypothetical protein